MGYFLNMQVPSPPSCRCGDSRADLPSDQPASRPAWAPSGPIGDGPIRARIPFPPLLSRIGALRGSVDECNPTRMPLRDRTMSHLMSLLWCLMIAAIIVKPNLLDGIGAPKP